MANRHGLDRRRHGHRQDGDPAGDGGELQRDRRARVHGRREGRSRRHQPAGAATPHIAERLQSCRSPTTPSTAARSYSGTCSATADTRSARPSPRWVRCCSRACSISTTRRKACSTSSSRSPTTTVCCCSTSRTCARCCSTSATTRRSSRRSTATSPPQASARSSAGCSTSSSRAARSFSASPRSTSTTSCRPIRRPRHHQHPRRRQAHADPANVRDAALCCSPNSSRSCPEVGDPEKPKLVFFFDEAHLLFDDAPKALLDKIEQVVRLIRSKGVGVYFVTQNPLDIPDDVLGQLGNRVQHALRAFTPRDQKAVKAAAKTFRANPAQCRDGDHGARRRRGAGLDAGGEGHARDRRARAGRAAAQPDRPDHARATKGDHRHQCCSAITRTRSTATRRTRC